MITEKNQIENVQVYPLVENRVSLNDKATKILFNLTEDIFNEVMQGQTNIGIVEKKKHKKHGKVKSSFSLHNINGGYSHFAPLDEGDRAVLDAIISAFVAGNKIVTLAMIQRILNGYVGEHRDHDNGIINKNQFAQIKTSVDRLMFTAFDPDFLKAFKALDYDGSEEITKAPILPCKRVKLSINGQISKEDCISILDESPLLKLAKIKKQIITYKNSLAYIPNLNNTPLVQKLKSYTFRRVFEIKKHRRNMSPILTLDDIFTKCRIKDTSNKVKFDARATLEKIFAHLQSKGEIKSYEWTKKGNTFHSVKITF